MATYFELLQAAEHPDLNRRVRVACVVAAQKIRTEPTDTPNHALRMAWAATVFANPDGETKRMAWVAIAQNRAATLAQIIGADDEAVQTAVDGAVNVFAV